MFMDNNINKLNNMLNDSANNNNNPTTNTTNNTNNNNNMNEDTKIAISIITILGILAFLFVGSIFLFYFCVIDGYEYVGYDKIDRNDIEEFVQKELETRYNYSNAYEYEVVVVDEEYDDTICTFELDGCFKYKEVKDRKKYNVIIKYNGTPRYTGTVFEGYEQRNKITKKSRYRTGSSFFLNN